MNYSKVKSFFSNQFSMSFTILIILLLIVLIRQNLINKDFKTLISFSNSISEINNTSIEKSKLSSKVLNNTLSKTVSELKEIENSLTSFQPSNNYIKHKELLLEGLKKNIELHSKLNSLFEMPNNDILSSKNKEAIQLKNDINLIFKQCNELKLPVSLGKDSTALSYTALNYINELIKLNRDKDITNNQSATYIAQIDNIYNELSLLNEDLFLVIDSMKKENRSLSTILDDINKKITTFNTLKSELYSLTVPIDLINSFNSLKTVFTNYETYINSLRNYVLHELNNSSDPSLLNTSKNNYENLNKSIDEFKSELNNDSSFIFP